MILMSGGNLDPVLQNTHLEVQINVKRTPPLSERRRPNRNRSPSPKKLGQSLRDLFSGQSCEPRSGMSRMSRDQDHRVSFSLVCFSKT